MNVVTGQSLAGEFCINGSGGLQDADSLPTCSLVIQGNTAATVVTVTNKSTGRYKWACTAPSIADGALVQVIRLATVDGMTDARPVFEAQGPFLAAALDNAPAGEGGGGSTTVVFTPMKAAVTNPRFTTKNIAEIPAGTAPTDYWDITDGNDQPVDLSGKTIRFVVASIEDLTEDFDPFDDELTGEYQYDTDDGITISGDDDNRVTVQHDADNTATAGDYRYFLLNVTDNIMLAKGKMPVTPAVLLVS
jgi:hypothetical protein